MSDLLHRKSNNIKRNETPQPNKTFQMPPTKKQKSTSIRVSYDVQDTLKALVSLGVADNSSDVIAILTEEYKRSMLSNEQKKQIRMIEDIAKKKRDDSLRHK